MIRFIAAVYVLGALVINLLFQSDVSLTMDVAPKINAGNELLVKVSLKKSDLSGFCRFQQELPAGFTATSVNTSNADFTFKDQKVRFIWLKLPEENEIQISYKITCDEHLKGSINLAGKFSFIEDNQRQSVDVSPQLLTIVPSPNIDPSLIVDVNDFGKRIPAGVAETSFGTIACVRQKPAWSADQNEYVVNILVIKDKLQKFAKIEEIVPKGYTALNINSRDGIFTYKDGKAKFLWMSLPVDPYFVVSYKLVPTAIADPGTNPMAIKGAFSYIVDDKTQSVNVFERDANVTNLNQAEIAALLKPQAPVMVAANTVPTGKTIKTANTQKDLIRKTVANNSLPVDTPKSIAQKPVERNVAVATKTQEIVKTAVVADNTRKVEPTKSETESLNLGSNGIYYRVQIAAGHKAVDIRSYFGKFKLDKSVSKEDHNGWIKYSVGSFDAYMDARDYRVHLWNTTPITDAFVSAYNEGKRITIQEALMVTSQKWIK